MARVKYAQSRVKNAHHSAQALLPFIPPNTQPPSGTRLQEPSQISLPFFSAPNHSSLQEPLLLRSSQILRPPVSARSARSNDSLALPVTPTNKALLPLNQKESVDGSDSEDQDSEKGQEEEEEDGNDNEDSGDNEDPTDNNSEEGGQDEDYQDQGDAKE